MSISILYIPLTTVAVPLSVPALAPVIVDDDDKRKGRKKFATPSLLWLYVRRLVESQRSETTLQQEPI